MLCARLMRELKGKVSVGAIFGSDEEIGGASTSFMMDKGYGASKLVIVLDLEQNLVSIDEYAELIVGYLIDCFSR